MYPGIQWRLLFAAIWPLSQWPRSRMAESRRHRTVQDLYLLSKPACARTGAERRAEDRRAKRRTEGRRGSRASDSRSQQDQQPNLAKGPRGITTGTTAQRWSAKRCPVVQRLHFAKAASPAQEEKACWALSPQAGLPTIRTAIALSGAANRNENRAPGFKSRWFVAVVDG